MSEIKVIRPQEGYQMMALSSSADIVIGGGSAGVGKTFTLLLECLRNKLVNGFGAVIFRRTNPMIRAEGGLWDASTKLFSLIKNAVGSRSSLEWKFLDGKKVVSKIKFSHLEYEKNIFDWQGSEIPLLAFDELTHFSRKMFFYLLSRNRSTCGVQPYVRATCNPDPDSWVRELIDWWIGEDGYPIPERQGVIRYFMVDNDKYIFGDTKQEVIDRGWHSLKELVEKSGIPAENFVKSLTFIGGSIYDNQELLNVDPNYLANLNAQDEATKLRLLGGNWNVKVSKIDVYDYYKSRDLFTNDYVEADTDKTKYITTDIALKGSDKFIVFVWQGKTLIDFISLDKSKGNVVINTIKQMARKHRVLFSNILFDNDGVGQFVDGFIPGAKEFNNGGRPLNGESYQNLKSQCYLKSGDAVGRGEYYITERVAQMKYDDSKTFQEQFLVERKAIKRGKPDNDGKLCVIPKKEMKVFLDNKSPDLMDAFMMREWFEMRSEDVEVYYS